MILTSIWERYFLREITKIFGLFLFTFYGLYVLIDYSTHSHSFKNYHFAFSDVMSFYAYEFIMRMDTLVPFAILIASIKTLCTLNTRNELVALMIGGITIRRLLFPFVLFGLALTALIYFNTEVLQPKALKYHKLLSQSRLKAKQKKHRHAPIQQILLGDGSSLIFQSYDDVEEYLYDAYWIRSIDDIYRIKYLFPYMEAPTGNEVEHLVRESNGVLKIREQAKTKVFSNMQFSREALSEIVSTPSDQSLSTLKANLPESSVMSEKDACLLTTYYHKLALPWICLLAVIAPAPFCIRFTRTLPVFFIYAFSLFGLVAMYLVLDSSVILAERQAVLPGIAIWVPFGGISAFFVYRFLKLG